MAWFDLAAMTASLSVVMLYFRRSIPSRYELAQLKPQHEAIRDMGTFRIGWAVLALLVFGFFCAGAAGRSGECDRRCRSPAAAASRRAWPHHFNPQCAAGCPLGDCHFLFGPVPGGVWPAQCRADAWHRPAAKPVCPGRRLGRRVWHRHSHGAAVVGDEQFTRRARGRAVEAASQAQSAFSCCANWCSTR